MQEIEGLKFVVATSAAARRSLDAEIERLTQKTASDEAALGAIAVWLEQNQPDAFKRGLWDAIREARKGPFQLDVHAVEPSEQPACAYIGAPQGEPQPCVLPAGHPPPHAHAAKSPVEPVRLSASEAASFGTAFARSPRRIQPRDAEHCDYPDCEQHWTAVVDMALAAMTKFHATFQPDEEDADLTPRTTSEAFREFVDEHARLLRIRASGATNE